MRRFEIFRNGLPQVPFKGIARLDVHLEKPGFMKVLAATQGPIIRFDLRHQGSCFGGSVIASIVAYCNVPDRASCAAARAFYRESDT
jgi:hypothetical protein